MTNAEVISIKEYFEMRLAELEKARAEAQKALDHRLDGMNEIRDSLRDQRVTFMTRDEYNAKHEQIVQQIRTLELSKAQVDAKASMTSVYISYFFSALAVAIGIAAIITRTLIK